MTKTYEQHLVKFERDYLMKLLHRYKYNITACVNVSGIGRPQFYNMMRRTEIELPQTDSIERPRTKRRPSE